MNESAILDEDRYEHVLEALGVVSKLTENKRLSLRYGHIDIEHARKLQFFRRWLYGDEREACLKRVKEIFHEAIHMARAALNELIRSNPVSPGPRQRVARDRHARRFGRLCEALEAASCGIETHKVTYKNDDRFCTRVKVFVDNVRDQLQEMQMTLQLQRAPSTPLVSSSPPSRLPPSPVGKSVDDDDESLGDVF